MASTNYTIQAGDTLSGIAQKYGTDVKSLAAANKIADPNKINAGATITIPDSGGSNAPNILSSDPNAPKMSSPKGTVVNGYISLGNSQWQKQDQSQNPDNYLTTYQDKAQNLVDSGQVNSAGSAPENSLLASIREKLIPNTPFPTAPNLTQTYTNLIASQGIGDLNNNLNTINQKIATIQSNLEKQHAAEEGSGAETPLSVVAGRETEESRQARIQLDSLNLQKGVLVDEINTKTQLVNTYMDLAQKDYQNAQNDWEAEFQVNSKIYDAFTSEEHYQSTLAVEQEKVNMSNWQTITNLMSSGQLSWDNMTTDQQNYVSSVEAKAGLPTGITQQMISSPTVSKVLNFDKGTGQGFVQLSNGKYSMIDATSYGYSPNPISLLGETLVSGIENLFGGGSKAQQQPTEKVMTRSDYNSLRGQGLSADQILQYAQNNGITIQ